MLKIGRGVFVNSNLLAMARGGITIGDHARIAANVQLISNNHDPYNLDVLLCKPVEIGDYAWIGAGATILPGVRAGRPGTADEVAHVAELLMSEKGAFISGSTFLIDGGATASYFYGPLKPEA